MLREVNRTLCHLLDQCLPDKWTWRGLRPKAEDGTTAQMPDSEANRNAYPYPPGQTEGCGFPMVKLGGLIDLSHGELSDFSQSNVEQSEQEGHFALSATHLGPGDLLIADRLYITYEIIVRLLHDEVQFIGRNHQARKIDFRKGRKLSPNQRLIGWHKPRQIPKGSRLNQEEWNALPDRLSLLLIRVHGPDRQGRKTTCYLITTLTDHQLSPEEEIASLYFHRWEIEVRFRDIKTTPGIGFPTGEARGGNPIHEKGEWGSPQASHSAWKVG